MKNLHKKIGSDFSLQHWFRNNGVVVSVTSIFACLVMSCILATNSGLISRDQFQFMDIVLAWHAGNFELIDLFNTHSAHIKPVYKSLFLLNAQVFDLNIFYEIGLGLVFLSIASMILFSSFNKSLNGLLSQTKIGYCFLLLLLVIFSVNKSHYYMYSLLTLGGFLGTLLFFWIIHLTEIATYRNKPLKFIPLFLLLMFTICGVAGGRSLAFFLSILVAYCLLIIFDSQNRSSNLRTLKLLAICGLVAQVIYWLMVSQLAKGSPPVSGFQGVLQDPIGALMFGAKAVGSGLSGLTRAPFFTKNMFLLNGFGIGVVCLYFFALYLYFKTKMWSRTLFPLILILYTGAFVSQLVIARFGLGFNNATAPRYVWELQIGVIGCVWVLYYSILTLPKRKVIFRHAAMICLIFSVLCVESANIYLFGRHTSFQHKSHERLIAIVHEQVEQPETATELPSWYCNPGVRKKAKNALLFIDQQNLNVFAK